MIETQPNAAPQAQAVGSGVAYAGFWLRFAAWGIDLFLSCATMIPVALIGAIPYLFFTNEAEGDPNEIMRSISSAYTAVYVFAVMTASWFYFIVFECSKLQATPGKLALGLRVTDEQGRRITFLRSVSRTVSKILSGAMLMAGYILAGVTPRKQALHDLIAGCLVVHGQQTSLEALPPPVGTLQQSTSIDKEPLPVSAEQPPPQADTQEPPLQAESEQPSIDTCGATPSPADSEQPSTDTYGATPSQAESEQLFSDTDNQSIQTQSIQTQLPEEPDQIPAGSKETDPSPDHNAESPDRA
jgi:uncharacterized RDD family membrane protein YckC